MTKRQKWVLWIGLIAGVGLVVLAIVASAATRRLDPYIRQQVVLYLQERFDSEVEIPALRVTLPKASSIRMLLTHRRGAWATIDGSGVLLRHRGRRDIPPMFAMKSFRFDVDLAGIFNDTRLVRNVAIDNLD